jgi:oxygen-dependent protoporphyrinogen oxidase
MAEIAVVGTGIAGLTAALTLQKQGHRVYVFERNSRCGGHIESEDWEGDVIEWGPQSLLASHDEFPYLLALSEAENKIRFPRKEASRRYIYFREHAVALPQGPFGLLKSPLLGRKALWALLREPFVPGRTERESVADFFSARLGETITRNLIDPFISGIYSGDMEKLSVAEAFPKIFSWQKEHGSIFKALLFKKKNRKAKKSSYRGLVSFQGGLSTLADALASHLKHSIEYRQDLQKMTSDEGKGFHLHFSSGSSRLVNAIVLASGAYSIASLIEERDPLFSKSLRNIPHPPIALVHILLPAHANPERPRGFGVLLGRNCSVGKTLGILSVSDVFPRRDGREHFTVLLGGRRYEDLRTYTESQLVEEARKALETIYRIDCSKAVFRVKLKKTGIPQYEENQNLVLRQYRDFHMKNPLIRLCGNCFFGISVLETAQNARQLCENWTLK